MPNDRRILAARVEALRQDLSLASRALSSDKILEPLRQSVEILFGGLIERKRADLDELARDVAANTSPDRGALSEHWRRLDTHAGECDRILKEYRAFLEGALVRSAGLDNGICDLADAFLRQLARITAVDWTRFTIVADDDFFAPMTDIIRLRYPHFSIWNLPVLAHEFGHFVTPQLKDRLRGTEPLETFRDDVRREISQQLPPGANRDLIDQAVMHLDEFIADAFAVHTAGPAFVAACVHLRFEPIGANADSTQHPSDSRRVYLQLALLDAMGADYAKVRKKLASMWADNLEGAGVSPMSGSDPWLDKIADRLSKLFQTLVPKARLDTSDWRRAVALGQRLLASNYKDDAESLTTRDILNGAWLCRLDHAEAEAPTISARARDLAGVRP
jgi:hypothetical protein